METRKVLEMGGGTLLVSIPKSWARRNRVTKGATLAVEELSKGKLMIRPIEGAQEPAKEWVVDYPGEDLPYVINNVTGAYLLGYDVIRVQGRKAMTREDREKLKSTIGRLIGLEIIDEDSRRITLQFLLEQTALNPEKIARRMAGIIEGMLKDTLEGMENREPKILSLVEERDDEVDRLYFLLVRIIRTAAINPEVAERYRLAPVEVLDYRVLASFLESAGDTVAELSKNLAVELPSRKLAKRLAESFRRLGEMQDLALRSFLIGGAAESRDVLSRLHSLAKELGQFSAQLAQTAEARTPALIELAGLIERASKIFVDIADLSIPAYPVM